MEYGIILQDLAGRIDRLEWNRKTFVLAVLARSLSPLVDEVRSARDTRGNVAREAVVVASQVSAGISVNAGHALVESLGQVIPHSEDITEVEEYYALDALVIIDAALRTAVRAEAVNGMVIYYALLPLYEYLCDASTDFLISDLPRRRSRGKPDFPKIRLWLRASGSWTR